MQRPSHQTRESRRASQARRSVRGPGRSSGVGSSGVVLPREFYLRKTEAIARELLGARLVVRSGRKEFRGIIIETEAYLGLADPFCHSFHGKKTERVRSMYLEGGHVYIYFIYGMYFCLNVVTRKAGVPEAILIRACIDESGGLEPKKLSGPGKLCRQLGISRDDDGVDLTQKKRIWIEKGRRRPVKSEIVASTRVGLSDKHEAAHWALRYRWLITKLPE